MTKVEICNRALAVIGHDRMIASLAEDTTEASRCAQFYPAALRNVLGAYNWDFAAAEVTTTFTSPSHTWAIPDGLVKLVSVREADGRAVRAVRTGLSVTLFNPRADGETCVAQVRYVSAADPSATVTIESILPHLVAEAIVYELAALLFGPMIGNVQTQDGSALYLSYQKMAGDRLQAAIASEDAEHAFMAGNRTDEAGSRTDIVNRALAKLGSETVVTDIVTDPSPIAARARLLFRSAVRDILRRRDWDFAAKEMAVALTWDDAGGFSRMRLPDDCVRICACFDDAGHPLQAIRDRDFYRVRTGGDRAHVRYVTSDIVFAEMPDFFIDLVASSLAVLMAPTVLQKPDAVAALSRMLEQGIAERAWEEAEETAFGGAWRNPFVEARR